MIINEQELQYKWGDILFYSSYPNDIYDTLISDWTNSPLVHVAVAVSSTEKVEALINGVIISPISSRHVAKVWSYMNTGHSPLTDSFNYALNWLHLQVGNPYGFGDVAEAILYKLEHGLTVEIGDHFDCSALALEFLLKAGGVEQIQEVSDVHIYTPAMLYKLLTT